MFDLIIDECCPKLARRAAFSSVLLLLVWWRELVAAGLASRRLIIFACSLVASQVASQVEPGCELLVASNPWSNPGQKILV